MSSSSSRPQLTVPSPTPFWPSSSSSRSRKFRGTLTPVCGQTHQSNHYTHTCTSGVWYRQANQTVHLQELPEQWLALVETWSGGGVTQTLGLWQENEERLSWPAFICLLLTVDVIPVIWFHVSVRLRRCCITWPLQWCCIDNGSLQTQTVTLPAVADITLSLPASQSVLPGLDMFSWWAGSQSQETHRHCW